MVSALFYATQSAWGFLVVKADVVPDGLPSGATLVGALRWSHGLKVSCRCGSSTCSKTKRMPDALRAAGDAPACWPIWRTLQCVALPTPALANLIHDVLNLLVAHAARAAGARRIVCLRRRTTGSSGRPAPPTPSNPPAARSAGCGARRPAAGTPGPRPAPPNAD